VGVVDEEVDCVEAAHAVTLDEARNVRVNLGEHGGDLLVVVLYFVVTILFSRAHALSFEVDKVHFKAIHGVHDGELQEVVTIFTVAMDHHNGGVSFLILLVIGFLDFSDVGIEGEGIFLLSAMGENKFPSNLDVLGEDEFNGLASGVQLLNHMHLVFVVLNVENLVLVTIFGLLREGRDLNGSVGLGGILLLDESL
jgi:hypothetical protein